MSSTGIDIDFNAQAILRKWPSLNSERISTPLGAWPYPYLVVHRSLDECIRQFQSVTQHHLYEIHTAQQIVARRPPAPPAADIPLLASTNGCYGIPSAVKCARDSWQRPPGRKQSERQNKAKKPAPNPVLRRETVLELAHVVRKARSRQSRKVCVA
jgi:hypothetical protein